MFGKTLECNCRIGFVLHWMRIIDTVFVRYVKSEMHNDSHMDTFIIQGMAQEAWTKCN